MNNRPIAEIKDGKVYVLQAGTPILVKTADVCAATGKSNQWIGQLVNQGTLNKQNTHHGGMFDFRETMRAYIDSRVQDEEADDAESKKFDRAKQKAEATLKATKARKEQLLLKELEGKMHRSEDVEALTTDLIFAIRSALIALPGRLAVSVADSNDAAEISAIITKEVYEIMDELSMYEYSNGKYMERVRERLKLGEIVDDGDDD